MECKMPRTTKRNHFTLTAQENALLKETLSDIPYNDKNQNFQIENLRKIAYSTFPDRLITKLESLKSNNSSYCVFENIPIDEVNGSPSEKLPGLKIKSGNLTENILLAFGALIAEPYSIAFESSEIVNNLIPHRNSKMEYTGLGSEVELDFHIENAAQVDDIKGDTSPLALLLLGVRKDPQVEGPKTLIADSREALKRMQGCEIETLYSKSFIIKKPFRWRSKSNTDDTAPVAVLSGPINYPRVAAAFYSDMVRPLNEEAEQAYNAFREHIRKVSKGIEITPGRLVFINNRFTLHAREQFKATYDQNGRPYRWVQRIFITNNLWAFRSFKECGNRIFNPD